MNKKTLINLHLKVGIWLAKESFILNVMAKMNIKISPESMNLKF